MTSSRSVLAGLVAVLALAGCGGDDDPAPPSASEATSDTSPGDTSPADSDGPNATISPDLPEELEGEVGPVEVVGDSLPSLDRAEIADDPALGMTAPILVGEDFDGTTVRIDAASDGPTMVVFLAHWCPHCNAEVPRLNELRDEGRFPEGLNIVAVSTGVNPGRPNFPPSQWFDDMDWTYPVLVDGVDMQRQTYIAADAYGLDAYPFIALLDADGAVAARWSGEHEPDEVIELISEHLGL